MYRLLTRIPLYEDREKIQLPRKERSASDDDDGTGSSGKRKHDGDDGNSDKKTKSDDGGSTSGKRPLDDADESERKRRKLLDNMEIPSGGSKSAQHGNIFQLKLLMLYLARGVQNEYQQFRLATELDEAGKFDDVVFQYMKGKSWLLRLIQAKHKEGETSDSPLPKINEVNLLSTDEKEEFSLQKYFNSHQEVLQRVLENSIYSVFTKSEVEDILLITNTDFSNDKIREYFESAAAYDIEKDPLLKVDKNANPQWKNANVYKIKNPTNNPLVSKLKPIFENNSHFYKLIEEISDTIQTGKQLEKVGLVKNYYYALLREVFDIKSDKPGGAEYHLEFKENFINGDKISDVAMKLRNVLIKEVTFTKSKREVAASNDFGQSKLASGDIDGIAKKLADCIVNNKPLTAADFGHTQATIMNEIVNPSTKKFRTKFIKPKPEDANLKSLRDQLKMEIINRGKPISLKEMETIEFRVSENFGESTLPENPDKLKKLAKTLTESINKKIELTPSLSEEFQAYHVVLANEVIDKDSKSFRESFVKGKMIKGTSTKPLPALTAQFRNMLINELIPIDNVSTGHLRKEKVKITKGFTEDFIPTADVKIDKPSDFAKELEGVLSKSTNNVVELTDGTVDKAFQANFQKLAGYVISTKFKKIRFSSAFMGSYTLPGNLMEFKNALETSLGKVKFSELYNYEFNVKGFKFKTCDDAALFRNLPALHNENQILDFFNKFKLVVNYPNRRELSSLVSGEMQHIFKDLDYRESHSLYLETMHDWMADRIGTFLTPDKATVLFNDVIHQLKFREMEGITKFYFDSLSSDYKFLKKYDHIVDFLKDPRGQILHLNTENVKLSSVKMVQILSDIKQRPEFVQFKEYLWGLGLVFISLDQLSHTNSYITEDVLNCFKDTTRTNLLVIPSNNKQKDVQGLSNQLLSIIQNNPKKKIILITKEGNELANKISQDPSIKNQNKYILQNDKNTLNDLTDASQTKLLDIEVTFQGKKVKLNQITGGSESLKELISSKILYELMVNKDISIGKDLRNLGETFEYYIPRSFIEIQLEKRMLYRDLEDIFVIHDLDGNLTTDRQNVHVFDKPDKAQEAFHNLRDSNPNTNVHLLKLESGKLILQKSFGSRTNLLQYRIVTNIAEILTEHQLIDSERDRIVIISDKPGTGKSTVLTDLGYRLQEKYHGLWVMRIDLLDYVDELKNAKSIRSQEEALNFLIDLLSNARDPQLNNNLEKTIFKLSFGREDKIALLFDGFDEISPHYKDTVVQLLQQLSQNSKVKKLLVTTRLNMREALEESLGSFSSLLEPFSRQNQRDFLIKYWQSKLDSSPTSKKLTLDQLIHYANTAINDLFVVNNAKEDFTGVPLQMRMIAEYFEITVLEGEEFPAKININELYEGFIKNKFEVFIREKEGINPDNPNFSGDKEILYEAYLEDHKQLALYTLFNDNELQKLISRGYKQKIDKIMGRLQTHHERRGLISKIINDRPHFMHRTIAEYFAANFFADEFNNQNKQQVQTFVITEILVQRDYKVIRAFINEQLSVESSVDVGDELNSLWNSENRVSKLYNKYGETLLHLSAEEGNKNIMAFILNSLNDHDMTRRQMLAATDANGLPPAQTAAIYDQKPTLEMLRDVYHYRDIEIGELKSQLFEQLKGNYEEAKAAQEKLQRIANWCLPKFMFPGSRRKRAGEKCSFSWWDVDRIAEAQTRDVETLRIDSEKFLEYTKTIDNDRKNKQLLELVQHIKGVDADRIVGRQKYLLDQIVTDEGFKNFIQKERINELAGNTIRDSKSKMSPILRNRLMNAAGKVQMAMSAYGVYSTVMTCKEGVSTGCALSLSSIGYSVLSQPIESALIKITPRVVSKAGQAGAKIIPKILGHDTKFLIQYGGLKYGSKIIKGVGGVLGGVFDIVDAAISTKALIDCNKKKNTDKPCSEKEIRDNIAGLSFAAISFVSGVALLLAGSTFGLSVAVGFVIMAASFLYNGISNIIEYEKKYDTTSWENFRIFWHTVAFQPMPEDVVHLAARSDYVNTITQQAAEQLQSMAKNLVGYAFGLGKILVNGGDARFERASSFIDLAKPTIKRYSLSRVQPKQIAHIKPICLPRKTGSNYEYNSESYDSYRSEYYCENGVAIIMDERLQSKVKDPTIFYDFTNIDGGYVAGNSSVHNIFYLKQGKSVVRGGGYTVNNFIVTEASFSGAIQTDWNSTNVIDVGQLENHVVTLSWKQQQPMYTYMKIEMSKLGGNNPTSLNIEKFQRESSICYKGSDKTVDRVNCVMEDVYTDHNLLVDGGGGIDGSNQDVLTGCTDAVVWPNTKVTSEKGNYTYYIRSEGYKGTAGAATSTINVVGEGKVTFPELILLKDCKEINYSQKDNTLSFSLPLGKDGTYTLELRNYLNKEKSPNFILVDKLGSYIVPKIFDKPVLDMFEMYSVYTDDSKLSAAVDYYDKLLTDIISVKKYKVFGLVKFLTEKQLKKAMFGSNHGDVLVLDDSMIYARGNSGSDVYLVNDDASWEYYNVDNYAKDLQLDVLGFFFKAEFELTKVNDKDLRLNVKDITKGKNKFIDILRYFDSEEYRHLMIIDQENNSFLPFHSEEQLELVPFYHASDKKNVFVMTNATRAVVDCDFDNMSFYKRDDSLLISSKRLTDTTGPLSVILKFFYSEKKKWKNLELYSYSKGSYQKIDLSKIQLNGASTDDVYKQIVKEYVIDFGRKSTEIAHNQNAKNGETSKFGEKDKIGVLIFKDIKPQHLNVSRIGDDVIFSDDSTADEVTIKNWHKDHKYAMSIIEFDMGLEPLRIFVFDKNVDLQEKLTDAKELQGILSLIGEDLHKMLKCTLAINSLHVTDSYRALGFTHFQQAATFIRNCDFPQFKLQHLRGIKIFLPVYYLQVYTFSIKLEGHDDTHSKKFNDIVLNHFSDVLGAVNARIKIDIILEDAIRDLDMDTKRAVEYFLLMSCSTYIGDTVLSETLKLEPSLKTFHEPKLFIKTMLLLMAKSHNDFLFKYPRVEKNTTLEIDYNNLRIFDITLIDHVKNNKLNEDENSKWQTFVRNKIDKIMEALSTDRFKTLLQGWDKNLKADILNLVTVDEKDAPFTAIRVEYKKKSDNVSKLNRGERDAINNEFLEDSDEVSFVVSGADKIHNSFLSNAFHWLNPLNWFSKNSVYGSTYIPVNNLEEFKLPNQHKGFNLLSEESTYSYKKSTGIPDRGSSTNPVEFSSHHVNSTLLLMDIVTRKYTGEKYIKSDRYYDYLQQKQKDEASNLAYSYYYEEM